MRILPKWDGSNGGLYVSAKDEYLESVLVKDDIKFEAQEFSDHILLYGQNRKTHVIQGFFGAPGNSAKRGVFIMRKKSFSEGDTVKFTSE